MTYSLTLYSLMTSHFCTYIETFCTYNAIPDLFFRCNTLTVTQTERGTVPIEPESIYVACILGSVLQPLQ